MTRLLPVGWLHASIPQLCAHYSIAGAKPRTWIESGELVAHNIATDPNKRPVYRIDRADFDAFWQGRATTAPPVPVKRRRASSPVKSFV